MLTNTRKWRAELPRQTSLRCTGGNKLQTYRLFKEGYVTEAYVLTHVGSSQNSACSLSMRGRPNTTGNWPLQDGKTSSCRSQILLLCSKNYGDENPFILAFPLYSDLRLLSRSGSFTSSVYKLVTSSKKLQVYLVTLGYAN